MCQSMNSDQKLQILKDVFDIDWDTATDDPNIAADLLRLVKAVVGGDPAVWWVDDPFIEILMDNFTDTELVWQCIRLD